MTAPGRNVHQECSQSLGEGEESSRAPSALCRQSPSKKYIKLQVRGDKNIFKILVPR